MESEPVLRDELLPLKTAAWELRISVRTMRRVIARRELPTVQLVPRGRVYVHASDLRRLVLARLRGGPQSVAIWGESSQ